MFTQEEEIILEDKHLFENKYGYFREDGRE